MVGMGCLLSSTSILALSPEVEPPAGPPGTNFAFVADGFLSNEQVNFWATAPDKNVLGNPAYEVRANQAGQASWIWQAPTSAQPGSWLMVGRGRDSGLEQVIRFEITGTETAAPPAQQIANVEPASGPPGTTFQFFAAGFDDEERLGFWVNTPAGTILSHHDYRAVANKNGRADWSWQAPADAQRGFYSMVARGEETNTERVILFEIR